VTAVCNDSRKAVPGSLFLAVKGFREDGHAFIASAFAAGSVAAVTESAVGDGAGPVLTNPHGDNRALLGLVAARLFERPWEAMRTVGITGTNGKTSSAHMTRWILERQGIRCGLMGTVGHIVSGTRVDAVETTPDSLRVTELMAAMRDGGDSACVMEVSSHALSLRRVEEVRYDAALFTNVTQDHLDFHGTMGGYIEAKMHLLDLLKPGGSAVFGTYAPGWIVPPGALTFGPSGGESFVIEAPTASIRGISYRLGGMAGGVGVCMRSPAMVNVYNSAGAIAVCVSLGLDAASAASSLAEFPGVPGRLESVDEGQDFLVAVDYAHTPDALERVLRQARELTAGRVIVVFGAGGDRDRAKRPLMGRIAATLSDITFVTSDNPRTEDPDSIIQDILAGVEGSPAVHVEPDRRAAIRAGIALARAGDVVIIAGKGHEDYQIIGRTRNRFDDREEARTALREAP
jgi:UDP-N-acetylmuramoyl-L-alanyl-D-glutamate--2,6-diaminopimelate ligase